MLINIRKTITFSPLTAALDPARVSDETYAFQTYRFFDKHKASCKYLIGAFRHSKNTKLKWQMLRFTICETQMDKTDNLPVLFNALSLQLESSRRDSLSDQGLLFSIHSPFWLFWNKYLPRFTCSVCIQGWEWVSKCKCVICNTKICQRKTLDLAKIPGSTLYI